MHDSSRKLFGKNRLYTELKNTIICHYRTSFTNHNQMNTGIHSLWVHKLAFSKMK